MIMTDILRQYPEWMPIETAPDKGVVLSWDGRILFCYIGEHKGEKRFYDADALEYGNNIRLQPTHWMPLPEAPK